MDCNCRMGYLSFRLFPWFYLGGGVDANALNIIYNLADLVNKFLFGLVIWYAAMRDSGVAKG